MWAKVFITVMVIKACLGASIIPCPENCRCLLQGTSFDDKIGLDCTSLDFLNRLLPKQISAIVELNASSIALKKIDPKLKYLKNLETLNLSYNKIDSVDKFPPMPKLKHLNLKGNQLKDIANLPKNLETFDVSANSLHHISKEWTTLKYLKTVDLNKNSIVCSCETVLYYNELLERGVTFKVPVTCDSPKTFKGKELKHVNCSMIANVLLNTMMGDQAPLDEDNVFDAEEANDHEDHDYIVASNDDKVVPDEAKHAEEFEGSGDEGSGHSEIIIPDTDPVPRACHNNCSTISPVGVHDEDNASPPPSLSESAKILLEDIIGKTEPEVKPVVEETVEKVHVTNVNEQIPIKEEEEEMPFERESDKSDVELVPTKNVISGEMERAAIGTQGGENSNVTYYVIGGLLAVFVALIIVVMIKKKNRKNKRSKTPVKENGHYEEMKPLNSNGKEKEKIVPKTPENTPLIKEENGKIDPLQTYVDNEVQRSEPYYGENGNTQNGGDKQSPKSDTLKVTIKASEIPDSIPKTPILVQRQLNNDGNYTTTFQSSP